MSVELSKHFLNPAPRPPVVMARGEGSYLWDQSGKRYLDFVQGWAVNALGHAPRALAEAVARQAATLISTSPAYYNQGEIDFSRRIAEASGLSRVFFTNSGAEANEGAVKLARKWGRVHKGGAHVVITTHDGFHGRTLAMMAATGKPGWDAMFPPVMPGFVKVPFGDADAVRAAIGNDTVAILVEPIQGEAGVVVPPQGYLSALRQIADERGLLLMLDEIQTGMGRTGALFAHQHERVLPDVMTLGKGIGGGVPLAALVASERAACFERGEQGGTYNGNPLAMAAGLAVWDAVTALGFCERVADRGRKLQTGLRAAGARHGIVEVRGKGLLVAARLSEPRAESVRDRAFGLGLLVNAPRPDTLRFMPALTVSEDEIASMLAILDQALAG